MTSAVLTMLKESMHWISLGLLVPTIAILLFLVAFTVVELGGLVVEIFTRRRIHQVNVPNLLKAFQALDADGIMDEINRSQMSARHRIALEELVKYRNLPPEAHQALARKLLSGEELFYERTTNRTDLVARLGPMLGLMATLIPLGPGLIAMGQGDTKTLADSLLTAFDATVTGLAAAGIAFAISRWRKSWYEDYLGTLESLMEGLLEVFSHDRRIEE